MLSLRSLSSLRVLRCRVAVSKCTSSSQLQPFQLLPIRGFAQPATEAEPNESYSIATQKKKSPPVPAAIQALSARFTPRPERALRPTPKRPGPPTPLHALTQPAAEGAAIFVSEKNPETLERAKKLSESIAIDVVEKDTDAEISLVVAAHQLAIQERGSPPATVDFLRDYYQFFRTYVPHKPSGAPHARHKAVTHAAQMLSPSVEVNPLSGVLVLDCTKGLNREDAFTLALHGFSVAMVEENPLAAAIIQDAIDRGLKEEVIKEAVGRMSVISDSPLPVLRKTKKYWNKLGVPAVILLEKGLPIWGYARGRDAAVRPVLLHRYYSRLGDFFEEESFEGTEEDKKREEAKTFVSIVEASLGLARSHVVMREFRKEVTPDLSVHKFGNSRHHYDILPADKSSPLYASASKEAAEGAGLQNKAKPDVFREPASSNLDALRPKTVVQ